MTNRNMRLIDANALANYADNQIVGITANDIMRFPTVDAEPVKHAEWKICGDGYYPYCSNCKNEPQGREMTSFCPNCGARMNRVWVNEEKLETNDQNSVKETSGITVKDFLILFSFIPYSVDFYECGSLLNGATITEVSGWNVDYVRGIYYKVYEPTIGDKNFAFIRPRKFDVILELEVIRPDCGLL